jgi:hypothetical protein
MSVFSVLYATMASLEIKIPDWNGIFQNTMRIYWAKKKAMASARKAKPDADLNK